MATVQIANCSPQTAQPALPEKFATMNAKVAATYEEERESSTAVFSSRRRASPSCEGASQGMRIVGRRVRRASLDMQSTICAKRRRPSLHVEDTRKAVEEERDFCEHQILILAGAAYLAEEQFKDMAKSNECGLCSRAFTTREEKKICLGKMENTMKSYQGFVFESEFVERRDECMQALARLTGLSQKELKEQGKRSTEWCAHEVKRGKVSALREQKLVSIGCKECVTCGRRIPTSFVPNFLRSADRQAMQMEKELHVHSSN